MLKSLFSLSSTFTYSYDYKRSAGHFNELVDLEKEYAACGRTIVNGLEDILRINEGIGQRLRQTMEDHDRQTLSKKFPNTLFSSPLSAMFSDLTLR
jgi:hypothetical protein